MNFVIFHAYKDHCFKLRKNTKPLKIHKKHIKIHVTKQILYLFYISEVLFRYLYSYLFKHTKLFILLFLLKFCIFFYVFFITICV